MQTNQNQQPQSIKPFCQICLQNPYKYKCPNCQFLTCSISCINSHKIYLNCSGVKLPYSFVSKKSYGQTQGRKDYNFLLEGIEKAKKRMNILKHYNDNTRFKLLRNYSKKLYNCEIKMAPSIFQKHRQNISFYFTKTKQIFWCFQIFYVVENMKFRFVSGVVQDSKQILAIFQQEFFEPKLLDMYDIDTRLQSLRQMLINRQYMIFTKQKKTYIRLTPEIRISKVFTNKTIQQFPTLYLVHQNHYDRFIFNQLINDFQ